MYRLYHRFQTGSKREEWITWKATYDTSIDRTTYYLNGKKIYEINGNKIKVMFSSANDTSTGVLTSIDIEHVFMSDTMTDFVFAPKVNQVTDAHTKITGTGNPGATVTVESNETLGKYEGTVDANGNFSIEIPKHKAGSKLTVTQTVEGVTGDKADVIVTDGTAPDAPKVNKVTDQDTKVTGTGEKDATVKVVVDGKEIGTGKVDDQGNYTVDIPKQPVGTEATVTLTDAAGNISQPATIKVEEKDVTAPEAPKVNNVTDQDTKVSGTGEKDAKVSVVVDGKEIGSGKVDDQGNFNVDIPKQSAGKEVVVTLTDAAGNTSQPTKTKVEEKDVTAPHAPKVNNVTDQDTKVSGTGEKDAKVSVVVDGKEIGSGKVDDQGNYSVDIPKQPVGKEITVTLTDAAGNISQPTKTKVQENQAGQDAAVKEAKQAIDEILTDLVQANYSHDFSIVTKGAIQVHVTQQHITEAQEKIRAISDKRTEKAQLQKELDRAQTLLDERTNDKSENVVQNGFFDFGLDYWKVWTGAGVTKPVVEEDGGKSRNVVKLSSNSSVEQALTGLKPNTTYELSLYAKSPSGEGMSVGVKNTGTTNVSVPVKSKDYSKTKIRFMTGADPTKTTLYVYKSAGTGAGYADVVSVKGIVDESVLKAPQVNEVVDTDTKVTGTGKPGASLSVTVNGKEIGKGMVDGKGNYTVTIPKQAEGTSIQVVQQENGSTSPGTIVQVKDKTAPTAPKVNPITDNDMQVKGTGEKGAQVSVKVNGNEIGTGTVDEKGNYTVDIPKQVNGTEVSVTLTDKGGNTSSETKVQVQADQAKLIEDAKQAVNQLLTDSIQANGSNHTTTITHGAIQLDVTQQHIDEAKSKVEKIADQRAEKAALQKEIDRAEQLLKGRTNEQNGNLVQNGLFDFGLDYWKPWLGTSAIAPSVQGDDDKSVNRGLCTCPST